MALNSPSAASAGSAPSGGATALSARAGIASMYPSMHSGTHTRLKGSDTTDCAPKLAMIAGSVASWAASDAHSSDAK